MDFFLFHDASFILGFNKLLWIFRQFSHIFYLLLKHPHATFVRWNEGSIRKKSCVRRGKNVSQTPFWHMCIIEKKCYWNICNQLNTFFLINMFLELAQYTYDFPNLWFCLILCLQHQRGRLAFTKIKIQKHPFSDVP